MFSFLSEMLRKVRSVYYSMQKNPTSAPCETFSIEVRGRALKVQTSDVIMTDINSLVVTLSN